MHGSFKTGAETTNWNLKKSMKASFTTLNDTPARREDFESVTGSTTYPLPFCATRWVEDKSVTDRLIEVWPGMKKIVAFWSHLPKSKQPSSKSYGVVLSAVEDELFITELGFFSYLASFFLPFLTLYQTDQPMIPYLYQDLGNLKKKYVSCCEP